MALAVSAPILPLKAENPAHTLDLKDAVASLIAAPVAKAAPAKAPPALPLLPSMRERAAIDLIWKDFRRGLRPDPRRENPVSLPVLFSETDARLKVVGERLPKTISDEKIRKPLSDRVSHLRTILSKIKPNKSSTQRLSLLIRLIDGLGSSNDEKLAAFEKQIKSLDAAKAGDPALLLALFEGGVRNNLFAAAALSVDARGMSAAGKAAPSNYPKPEINLRIDDANIPSPEEAASLFAGAAIETQAQKEPALWERLAESAAIGAAPFANLTPKGRQDLFVYERGAAKEEIFAVGKSALEAAGEKVPAGNKDVDAALLRLRRRILYKHNIGGNPKNAADRRARSKILREESPGAALYFARRGLYQMFVHKALSADSVPLETRFAAWELGLDGGKERSATLTKVQHGRTAFTGFRRTYEDGSTRFEGVNGSQGLTILSSPKDNVEMTTFIEVDGEGKAILERTSVIDLTTKHKIRESLRIASQAFLRMIEYTGDAAGTIKWIHTCNTKSGEQVFEDREGSTRTTTGADGKAIVTPIGRESGAWTQHGRVQDKKFIIERLVQRDGTEIEFLSEHVMRIKKDGKTTGLEVRMLDLHAAETPRERNTLSWKIAKEIVEAFGWDDKDSRRSRPLHNYLFDTWTKDDRNQSMMMTVDTSGKLQLAYTYANGTKRIERSKFSYRTTAIYSSEYKKSGFGLVVLRPTLTDRSGRGTLSPKLWREYLEKGGYTRHHTMIGFEEAGWFSNAKSVEYPSAHRYYWVGTIEDGHWKEYASRDFKKIEKEVAGTSTLGIIGTAIHETPVIGHVLQGGEWVGKTLWTGIMAAPPTIVYAISGNTDYGVAMSGSWTKNPAMNLLVSDEEHLAKMDNDMWFVVLNKARINRENDLNELGLTEELTDMQERNKLVRQWRGKEYASLEECLKFNSSEVCNRYRYSMEERMRAVKGFGAMTYGDTIIEGAQEKSGAAYYAQNTAGWGLKIIENVGETVFNPVIWATFGVGRGVQALTALRAAGSSARFLPAALSTARVTHTVMASTLYATWGVSGIDNLGQTIVAIKDGDTEKAWKKAADFSTDLFFVWMMAREARSSKAKGQAEKALAQERALLAEEVRMAESALKASEIQAPKVIEIRDGNGKGPGEGGSAGIAAILPKGPKLGGDGASLRLSVTEGVKSSRPGQGLIDTGVKMRGIEVTQGRIGMVEGNLALKAQPRLALAEARVAKAAPKAKGKVIDFAEARARLRPGLVVDAKPLTLAEGKAVVEGKTSPTNRIAHLFEAQGAPKGNKGARGRGIEVVDSRVAAKTEVAPQTYLALVEAKTAPKAETSVRSSVAKFFEGRTAAEGKTAPTNRIATILDGRTVAEGRAANRGRGIEVADSRVAAKTEVGPSNRIATLLDGRTVAEGRTANRGRGIEVADSRVVAKAEVAPQTSLALAEAKTAAKAESSVRSSVAEFFEGFLSPETRTSVTNRVAKFFEGRTAAEAKTATTNRIATVLDGRTIAEGRTANRGRGIEVADSGVAAKTEVAPQTSLAMAETKTAPKAETSARSSVAEFFEGFLTPETRTSVANRVAKFFEGRTAAEGKTAPINRIASVIEGKSVIEGRTASRARGVEVAESRVAAKTEVSPTNRIASILEGRTVAEGRTASRTRGVEVADARLATKVEISPTRRIASLTEARTSARTRSRTRTVEIADARLAAKIDLSPRIGPKILTESRISPRTKTTTRTRSAKLAERRAIPETRTRTRNVEVADARLAERRSTRTRTAERRLALQETRVKPQPRTWAERVPGAKTLLTVWESVRVRAKSRTATSPLLLASIGLAQTKTQADGNHLPPIVVNTDSAAPSDEGPAKRFKGRRERLAFTDSQEEKSNTSTPVLPIQLADATSQNTPAAIAAAVTRPQASSKSPLGTSEKETQTDPETGSSPAPKGGGSSGGTSPSGGGGPSGGGSPSGSGGGGGGGSSGGSGGGQSAGSPTQAAGPGTPGRAGTWSRGIENFVAGTVPKAMAVPSKAMPGFADPIDPVRMASQLEPKKAVVEGAAPLLASAPGPAPLTEEPGVGGGSGGTFSALWAFVTRDPFPAGKKKTIEAAPEAGIMEAEAELMQAASSLRNAPKKMDPVVRQASMNGGMTQTPRKRQLRARRRNSGYHIEEEPRPWDPVYASLALQAFVLLAFLYLFFISPMPYALGWTQRKPR